MADEKNTKQSAKTKKLVDEISKLTALELSELVNALQDTLGVSAAPMAAAPVAAQAAQEGGEEGEKKDEGGATNLILTGAGDNKIAVIKALREINQNWGLKEAKDMTEQVPTEVLKDAKPDEVKDAAEKLKAAGATVETK